MQVWGHAVITSQKSRPSPTKSTADGPDIVLGHAESEKHILLTHSFLDTQARFRTVPVAAPLARINKSFPNHFGETDRIGRF
jgi:hypothetical protein